MKRPQYHVFLALDAAETRLRVPSAARASVLPVYGLRCLERPCQCLAGVPTQHPPERGIHTAALCRPGCGNVD